MSGCLRLLPDDAFLKEYRRRRDAVKAHDAQKRYKVGKKRGAGVTMFTAVERANNMPFAMKKIPPQILHFEKTQVGEYVVRGEYVTRAVQQAASRAAKQAASRAVLQAAIGNLEPLSKLSNSKAMAHALTSAAAAGLLEPLTYLLDAGAPIEEPDARRGRTPLMLASNGGHEAVVCELIARGADVNAIVADGNVGDNALPLAAKGGHPIVLKLLIEAGADLAQYGGNAISLAAVDGHVDAIRVLVEAGVEPDRPSNNGEYALPTAATGGHLQAVKCLLDGGSGSVAAQQALEYWETHSHPEVVGLLRDRICAGARS